MLERMFENLNEAQQKAATHSDGPPRGRRQRHDGCAEIEDRSR